MSLFIKNIFLVQLCLILAILYPTSLANLVVEVGIRHSHQTLLWPSLPTHIWVWWKCMASYCWYHNGRTFINSCWRARKVYANYICYILGRSSSCLIFCNYYSRQNLTWRMWSYILSVNTVFNYPTKLHIAGRRVIWKTRSKRRHGKLYVYLKMR